MGRGRCWGKVARRWSWCKKMCTYVNKCKNDSCGNNSRKLGKGRCRRVAEVYSCMIYFIHCKNLCKCHMIQSHLHILCFHYLSVGVLVKKSLLCFLIIVSDLMFKSLIHFAVNCCP
jgi:hypothetical protein